MNKHIINEHITVLDALKILNTILDENMTLFVVSDENKMLGTLTDGDIRRAMVDGTKIESPINKCIHKNFMFIEENNIDSYIFIKARKRGIKMIPLLDKSKHIKKIYDLKKTRTIIPVDAVIMAGGKGKRLLPLTTDTPKPMLPLGDKPIIEHNIDRLIKFGIENIYISVNYLAKQIENYFGDGSSKGISIKYIHEDFPLGTIGALKNASDYKHDNLLIMNSDLFTNIDFEAFYLRHLKENATMSIASIPYTVNIPYAIFETDKNKILSFKEKPVNTYYASAGIYLLKKEFLNLIPKNKFYNTTDLMNKLIENNETIIHNTIYGYWIDIGQHEDYQKAKDIIKHLSYD